MDSNKNRRDFDGSLDGGVATLLNVIEKRDEKLSKT